MAVPAHDERDYKFAKKYNLELVECVDYAYNEIKNRTGKMIDGSFVKDK